MSLSQRVCHLGVKAQLRWLSLSLRVSLGLNMSLTLSLRSRLRDVVHRWSWYLLLLYNYTGFRILTSLCRRQCLVVSHLHLSRRHEAFLELTLLHLVLKLSLRVHLRRLRNRLRGRAWRIARRSIADWHCMQSGRRHNTRRRSHAIGGRSSRMG